jgi:hypothetical protein
MIILFGEKTSTGAIITDSRQAEQRIGPLPKPTASAILRKRK